MHSVTLHSQPFTKELTMMRHVLNPPNWLTAVGMFCSVYALALLLAADEITSEILVRASVLVVVGGMCDLLDGHVARLMHRASAFGAQLDSIADIISFGVVPALIAWCWKLHALEHLGIPITCWFVLCTAFRLARFNVNEQEDFWPFAGHSQGLTSTMAGGSLITLVWVSNGYLAEVLNPRPAAVGALIVALGFLMVSSIPYRNFKDVRRNAYARYWLAMSWAACLAAALGGDISM